MVIDAHCHLEKKYYDDVDAVIQRAHAAGVEQFVAIGASSVAAGAQEAVALAEQYNAVFATAGIHPHEAADAKPEDVEDIARHLDHAKVVALGEIGLDYYYDNAPRAQQRTLFAEFLKLGVQKNIPIMLHTRDAHEDTVSLIKEHGIPEAGGVIHCFSAGPDEAKDFIEMGFYLSIPGIVTFKKAEALQEAVRQTPLDKMLVETDAPYLAPIPYRGKQNEPAYVLKTVEKVAELKGVSLEEAVNVTSQNTRTLFGLPMPEAEPVI